jgi:hypothetical protein
MSDPGTEKRKRDSLEELAALEGRLESEDEEVLELEKLKRETRDVPVRSYAPDDASRYRSYGRVWLRAAIGFGFVLIGLMFLFIQSGALSFTNITSIGSFFGEIGGSIGRFAGEFGRTIGQTFGEMGRSIGQGFAHFDWRALANLWPMALIFLGLVMLIRSPRRGRRRGRHRTDRDEPYR